MHPVSAEYLKVIYQPTPTNSPLETYVYNGDQIYQNRVYDLRGVVDYNLSLAHWSNYHDEDVYCTPDQVVDLNYITNNQTVNVSKVLISDPPFVTGNWYRWDGCHNIQDHTGRIISYGIDPNENHLAFTVLPLPSNDLSQVETPVPTIVQPTYQSGSMIRINTFVPTPTTMIVNMTSNTAPQSTGPPWWFWPGIVVGILVGGFIFWKFVW